MSTKSTQGSIKPLKQYKRGKWVRVTKGPFAGTKRWFSAETRNKMAAGARKNFHGVVAKVTTKSPTPTAVKTGSQVYLSQETASLLMSKVEGLDITEAVNYAVKYFCNNSLDGRILKKPQDPEIVTLPSFGG